MRFPNTHRLVLLSLIFFTEPSYAQQIKTLSRFVSSRGVAGYNSNLADLDEESRAAAVSVSRSVARDIPLFLGIGGEVFRFSSRKGAFDALSIDKIDGQGIVFVAGWVSRFWQSWASLGGGRQSLLSKVEGNLWSRYWYKSMGLGLGWNLYHSEGAIVDFSLAYSLIEAEPQFLQDFSVNQLQQLMLGISVDLFSN